MIRTSTEAYDDRETHVFVNRHGNEESVSGGTASGKEPTARSQGRESRVTDGVSDKVCNRRGWRMEVVGRDNVRGHRVAGAHLHGLLVPIALVLKERNGGRCS